MMKYPLKIGIFQENSRVNNGILESQVYACSIRRFEKWQLTRNDRQKYNDSPQETLNGALNYIRNKQQEQQQQKHLSLDSASDDNNNDSDSQLTTAGRQTVFRYLENDYKFKFHRILTFLLLLSKAIVFSDFISFYLRYDFSNNGAFFRTILTFVFGA